MFHLGFRVGLKVSIMFSPDLKLQICLVQDIVHHWANVAGACAVQVIDLSRRHALVNFVLYPYRH